jgi:uncharacterized membrane protein
VQKIAIASVLAVFMGLGAVSGVMADPPATPSTIEKVRDQASQLATQVQDGASQLATQVQDGASQLATQAQDKMNEVAATTVKSVGETAQMIENSEQAKQATANLLSWIYQLAELLSFDGFYWLAFALMVAGVVSWSGQVVLAKLVVGTTGNFDIKETISDIVVLAISLFGLVLTTQAAVENSTFTQSTVAVLSSAGVGVVLGVILYFWGQALELESVRKK